MSRTQVFFILTAFAYFCTVTAVNVTKCGDEDVIKKVDISKCSEPPCILKVNDVVVFKQVFVPKKDYNKATTLVTARLGSTELPFIGVDGTDACNNFYDGNDNIVSCPLKAGQEYQYIKRIPILFVYAVVRSQLPVTWKLGESDTKEVISCFKIDVKINL